MSDFVSAHLRAPDALEQNLWSLWANFGRGPGCALHGGDHELWFDTPIGILPYNGVLRFAQRPDADVAARVDTIFAHYRKRGVPFMWIVHPSAPAGLDALLRRRGFEQAEICAGMAADVHTLPGPGPVPGDVEIREVLNPADGRAFLELVAWRWNLPEAARAHIDAINGAFGVGFSTAKARAWLAWKDGAPVAKVLLHLHEGAAGLYGVATKPEARGAGLARALTLTAFRAARDAGYRLGVLHSSPMARSLYAKLGFREVAPFGIFTAPNQLHL